MLLLLGRSTSSGTAAVQLALMVVVVCVVQMLRRAFTRVPNPLAPPPSPLT